MTFEPMVKGQSAEGVADLKGRLVFLGYLTPLVDYSFDDRTEAAVQHYQGDVGFEATDEIDEGLWAQLCSDTDAHGYRLDQALAGAYDQNAAPTHITEHADHTVTDVRMARDITEGVLAEHDNLEGNFKAAVEDLVLKLNSNFPLDDATTAALQPLMTAGPQGLDHFIEHTVGIPTSREVVRDELYGKLVEAFEEMVLGATEFAPNAMDGAAATLLAGVNPERYGSPAAVVHEREEERHHKAHATADDATHHLPHGGSH